LLVGKVLIYVNDFSLGKGYVVQLSKPIWIVRDYIKCTGCRRCEIACSLKHEDWIWPEASRIKVFMPFPGVEVPHVCAQCDDYPCVKSCPVDALSVDQVTTAVLVDREKCISCSKCIAACPGNVPFLHPKDNKATICDLCNGDPECTKVCTEANYDAIYVVDEEMSIQRKLFSRKPKEVARQLAVNIYGEKGEKVI
jgi:Fe-S-cluster-containing hydrogenase component 2